MLQDFLRKCDEDTKEVIVSFITVSEASINRIGIYANEIYITKKDGTNLDNYGITFMYLLITCLRKNEMLKELLNNYGISEDVIIKYYSFSKNTKENLEEYSNMMLSYECMEKGFCNLPGFFVKGYCDNRKSVICIERILYRYLKNEKCENRILDYPLNTLMSDEFLEELLHVAEAKENNKNYISSTGSNKKLEIPFGNVLTRQEFKYNPLVGRTKELRKMSAFLMDDEKSLIIYGSPGTGKTTLIKGLAYNIQNKNVPDTFLNKEIVEVSASELISGCSLVGMVEERLLGIIKKLIENENSILFIDEIHTLMGLGQGSHSNNDVSNILKPYLGDGRIKIVGATTTDEYKIIKNDGAFSRRFNNLYLPDLTDHEMLNLLLITSNRFAENKQISINYDDNTKNDLLRAILNLSKRAIEKLNLSKYNPDFALTLLRMGYDFAALDGKKYLDADYIIEGINNEDSLNDELKEEFKNSVYKITKK